MPRSDETDRICKESWNRALWAYGTAQVFLKRSHNYRTNLRWLPFIGIGGPVLIGVMVIHGLAPDYLPKFLLVVAIVSVVEALVSLWSLVAHWAENLSYAQARVPL